MLSQVENLQVNKILTEIHKCGNLHPEPTDLRDVRGPGRLLTMLTHFKDCWSENQQTRQESLELQNLLSKQSPPSHPPQLPLEQGGSNSKIQWAKIENWAKIVGQH